MNETATALVDMPPPAIDRQPSTVRDALALTFVMTFPALMAWIYFVVLSGDQSQRNPALQLALGAGKVVQFTFPLVFVWLFERSRLRPAGPTFRGLKFGVGFGVLAGAGIWGLAQLL